MNYAKSYIDNYRKYAAAVAAEKAARAALEAEYNDRSITKITFNNKLAAILETAPKEIDYRKAADKIIADFDAALIMCRITTTLQTCIAARWC